MARQNGIFIVTANGLNLRAAPRLTGAVIGVLHEAARVQRLDVSGDGYWYKISHGGSVGWASHKYLRRVVADAPVSPFRWFDIAYGEIGVHEVVGAGDNPRIVEYLRSTNLDAPGSAQDETPWCSAFVNWCVERAGYAGTDSAWARSWLSWGMPSEAPVPGCIAVLQRNVTAGHVGFFLRAEASQLVLLGGNQSDGVSLSSYPSDRLLGFRVPT